MTTSNSELPVLLITMGDPAGVGPEVTVRGVAEEIPRGRVIPVVVGDARVVRRAADKWTTDLTVNSVESPRDADVDSGVINVLDIANCDPEDFEIGEITAYTGNAAYEYVVRAAELCLSGDADGIVTAPLNKKAMVMAGHEFDGHTGLLAHLCDVDTQYMILGSPKLRVIHLTTHLSLVDALKRVETDRIVKCTRAANEHAKQLGFANPRIAVCGVNPHSGDGGLFGVEEAEEIAPAIKILRAEGIDADGPVSPDSAYRVAYEGGYDIVVAMYHDQGHIPMKLVGFSTGVNVTVGLPIIRTSVDHGTAFDIAWEGKADHTNMVAAIEYAYKLATGTGGQ
ncbi:MAG: 4-hydroxythreonine-4-phosphate dehydrogenase PdxA [Chloroflexi bacterium]|jgi:4-phospho-D-threonate 3-dehydrogenase / 4-phospho-D-erythronate 3-dehydrogenase|nr:4-hydroxythreonine-4-phosphate dehydrogenase PdxA [Chloroflexota bacterium]